MTASRYLLVLTRESVPEVSAAVLGAWTGRLASWVAALRRWRLLVAVAAPEPSPEPALGGALEPAPGATRVADPVRGGLLVYASDLSAAYQLARSCPVTDGLVIDVLPVSGEGSCR
jgi:hypothetical protein